jgi:ATP-dependent Clp protease ATP-binding subunit ClpA
MEQNQTINEGICLKCAKELGIKPVDDIMEKMGITEEDIERMDMEMTEMLESGDLTLPEEGEDGNGHTPPIDFRKLFGGLPIQSEGESADVPGEPAEQKKKDKKKKNKEDKSRQYLSLYCRDLTDKARKGELGKVIGREREFARLVEILCRHQKNNPCLIGEPGVGKTAIAEALAQRIVAGEVPYKLKNKEVHLVDLTAIVAGTQFRGQFEARIKGLIEEVRALGNVILVIDEVHSIVGAGDAEGGMNAANILKPALSRGEIQVIGATTLAEYRKYIEKDAALERRFQPIMVDEPSVEATVKILCGIKDRYENFHRITVPDEILRRATILSERYITDRYLPDKAIDLLDEAGAYLSINSPCLKDLAETEEELAKLQREQEELEATEPDNDEATAEKYKALAENKQRQLAAGQRLEGLKEEQKRVVLTTEELARVIEIWTGIPASSITELEYEKIDKLGARIKERIVGQQEAVDAVTRAIKRSRAGISYKKKPVSFIFAGPTGVGKTELVKTLADQLFDSPETLIRLDMTEFMEKHSVSRIIGAPPGYVGYDDAGQLTEKIRRKPYSVVLFDEIEKAHPDVLNILLQILDDGRVTDAQGRQVNFENTVIVMTTNAGSSLATNTAGFGKSAAEQSSEKTLRALEQFLRPEFLNRVDEIITFRQLDEQDFAAIARIMLSQLAEVMEERGITMRYTDAVAEKVAKDSYSVKYGARNMRRYIQKHLEDELATKIIASYEIEITGVHLDVKDDAFEITCL